MKTKTAVLATGGVDSTVLLYRAVAKGREVAAVAVDYGQVVFGTQMSYLDRHLTKLELGPAQRIRIPTHSWQHEQSGLFRAGHKNPGTVDVFGGWDRLFHYESFVEGRNLTMLAYALAWCSAHGFDELWAGYFLDADEWAHSRSYKMVTSDAGPQFVDAVNTVAVHGFSHHVRFRAPFIEERAAREEILAEGKRLGVDLKKDTYSCHFYPPCGTCFNCRMREDI
jgi:7-cyano-7-deazaguanine synthase in queuosine biosynthesis